MYLFLQCFQRNTELSVGRLMNKIHYAADSRHKNILGTFQKTATAAAEDALVPNFWTLF